METVATLMLMAALVRLGWDLHAWKVRREDRRIYPYSADCPDCGTKIRGSDVGLVLGWMERHRADAHGVQV